MGDHFTELVLGEAVIERALEMADELLFAAECDQGRAGDQAAVALGESRALPDFAEQHPLAEIDQSRHDIADLLAGRRGLCLRHGFLLLDPTVRSGVSLARGSSPTAIISVHVRVTPASRHAPFRARFPRLVFRYRCLCRRYPLQSSRCCRRGGMPGRWLTSAVR